MTGSRFKTVEPVRDGKKRCTKCGLVRPVSDFPIRIDRNRQPRSHCTPCGNAAAVTPEARARSRAARYRRKYGLSVEQVEAMLDRQNGCCAICMRRVEAARWHLNHDHLTGRARGILCGLCNKGLGQFKDDAVILRAAAAYIERPPHSS